MNERNIKVWITRYALTEGIFSCLATLEHNASGRQFVSLKRSSSHYSECFFGNDWHLSYEDAIMQAEKMRIAKIVSLQKQIKKLDALSNNWSVKEVG